VDADAAVRRLFDRHRIVARAIAPLEAIRFSIHAYNTEEEMEAVVRAVREMAET
jgi:selenocysteine lyase/cysteine desulfurase